MGGAREGSLGRKQNQPQPWGRGGGGALWVSGPPTGMEEVLVLPTAPGPRSKQPRYFVSVPCGHLQMTAWGGGKFWVSAEGPLPTGSGRSAQAEHPQAAALHRTATGVFFRSIGGILPATAFDPE